MSIDLDLTKLSDEDLIRIKKVKSNEVAKYDTLQMATKVFLNSLYGGYGTPYFRYYDIRQAEAITLTGQFIIQYLRNGINKFLNKLYGTENTDYSVAGDTDSLVINFNPIVEKVIPNETDRYKIAKFLDKVSSTQIEPLIEKLCGEISNNLNAPNPSVLVMKRETIADKAIWTAKKKYIMNVLDSEGVIYNPPKLKIMGLETVKSSTPAYCRKILKESIEIIIDKDESFLIEYVKSCLKDFKQQPLEEISFPRGVNGLETYANPTSIYVKGTPIHVRGSLLFNHFVKKNGLTHQYPLIKSGDKIKFVYLRTPNPLGENIIAFPGTFPKDLLNIKEYVDYDKQFDKSFIEPLKIITSAIDWKTERIATLDDFFE